MAVIDSDQMYLDVLSINDNHTSTANALRERVGDDLTDKGAVERLQNVNADKGWTKQLDALQAEVDASEADNAAAVDRARAELAVHPGSTDERLLAEMQYSRVWPRLKADLDKAEGVPLLDAAVAAMKGADGGVRPILAQELQPYLTSRRIPQAEIDRRLLREVSPKFAKALDVQAADAKSVVVARHNLGVARKRVDSGLAFDPNATQRFIAPGSV